MERMADSGRARADRWTFLTNHARVLLGVARDPEIRLRDLAATANITERAAQAIIADLEAAGYITRTRVGRRNRYTIHPTGRFRHPAEADHPIADLLAVFTHREDSDKAGQREASGEDGAEGGRAAGPGDAAGGIPGALGNTVAMPSAYTRSSHR